MQPPPPAGNRRTLWIVLGSAGVFVVIVLLVVSGLVAWRLLASGNESAGPLRIVPVASATPGACPSGGPGVASVDGRTCYRLGQGGMTVRALEKAEAERDPIGSTWHVNVEFSDGDATQFTRLTRQYVHKQLALVSGGRVLSAPTVQEPIAGSELQISGAFSADQAKKIAARLPT